MKTMNMNLISATVQNAQSARKAGNHASKPSQNFDNMLADSIRRAMHKNSNGAQDASAKTNEKTRANIFRDNTSSRSVLSQDELESKESQEQKNPKVPEELLSLVQGMEELLQKIMPLSEGMMNLDPETSQKILEDIKDQLGQLLSSADDFVHAATVNGEDRGTMDAAFDIMDTLMGLNEIADMNPANGDSSEKLLKLQGALEQQIGQLHTLTTDKEGAFRAVKLSNDDGSESTEQEKFQRVPENGEKSTEKNEGNEPKDSLSKKFQNVLRDNGGQHKPLNFNNGDKDGQPYTILQSNQFTMMDSIKADAPLSQQVKFENIFDQLSNRMQVHVFEEGSEMSLHLKPDHLGKLAMKISIERGIVVAKFMAESQIVKEILESNFSALKDALHEKGLNVQELSVFVGSDSNFQQRQNNMPFGKQIGKTKLAFDEESYGSGYEDAAIAQSQPIGDSNIDFLA